MPHSGDIFIRRSIRSWKPQPVEKEKIELLLEAAMQAPSARNGQPWEFLVVTEKSLLEKLSQVSPGAVHCASAPAAILVIGKTAEAPSPLFWHQDCAAATQNILLQCVALGLGGVWIGISPNAERIANCQHILELPIGHEVFCIVALGYPGSEQTHRYVNRFKPECIHWEKY